MLNPYTQMQSAIDSGDYSFAAKVAASFFVRCLATRPTDAEAAEIVAYQAMHDRRRFFPVDVCSVITEMLCSDILNEGAAA